MVLFLLAGASLAAIIFVVLFVRVRTDQEPRGPLVQNDTAEIIVIFLVDPDGSEYLGPFLRPGETKELFGLCGTDLVARDQSSATPSPGVALSNHLRSTSVMIRLG